MRIPINMGVKGRVTATLTNTETGEKQEVKGDNLILNHYLDWAMEQGLGILGTQAFNRCYIGNGSTPPQPADTTFNGTELAVSSTSALIKDLLDPNEKFEFLSVVEGINSPTLQRLAVTPDGKILVVGSSVAPYLQAFLVGDDYDLTPLHIESFSDISSNCRYLSIGGDTLFVGVGDYGKVFQRSGNDFMFLGDIHDGNYPYKSTVSKDGKTVAFGLYSTSNQSVKAYSVEGGAITSIPLVSSISVDASKNIAVSNDGNYIGVAFNNTPYTFVVYKLENGAFEDVFIYELGDGFLPPILALEGGFLVYSTDCNYYSFETGLLSPVSRYGFVDSRGTISVGNFFLNNFDYVYVNPASAILRSGSLPNPQGKTVPSEVTQGSAAVSENGLCFLGYNEGLGIYKMRTDIYDKQVYSRQWTFPAGTGTGTVNRVGLQANSGTGYNGNNRHVAQIVLPEGMEKTDLHQLDVIWEIEVENPGVWEGVIPGGSRDGSDLAWQVTINEEQFRALVSTRYSIPANWFGVTGTPNVRIGTSNEESDLIFDRESIRGEQIEYISSTAIREINPYTPGSLKRTIRLFLEVNQGNGQIGEVVLGGSTSSNSLARITFDPPLDKPHDVGEGANPYRVYLDLEIGWQRGE